MEHIQKEAEHSYTPELALKRFLGLGFCVMENQIHALLVNIRGEILRTDVIEAKEEEVSSFILEYINGMVREKDIKAIGIGMPGVVEKNGFLKMNETTAEWYHIDIKNLIWEKYNIPVVVENNLNTTAIGIGLGYGRGVSYEDFASVNMAYLYFESCSVNAGLIAGGQVIRGYSNYAGELGLIPTGNNKLLYESMSETMDHEQFVAFANGIIVWLCGTLNPQYVALGGPALKKECIGAIADGLHASLPKKLFAEIVCSHDIWHDYHEGMAYLTARKLSDELRNMELQSFGMVSASLRRD